MKTNLIALDLETSRKGIPSVEYYKPDFQVDSVAIAWREDGVLKTYHCESEPKIKKLLERIKLLNIPTTVYNAQFEYAVVKHRFPGLEDIFKTDTMRLVQVADNGNGIPPGFKLTAGAARWLPVEYQNHKEPYYERIRERGEIKKGKEASHLHLLTPEELAEYNTADAVITLLLYERLTQHFEEINYDWTIDHNIFFANLPYTIQAEGFGVFVDRVKAEQAVNTLRAELSKIESEFLKRNNDGIGEVESRLRAVKYGRYKTERGRLNASLDDCKFKISSTKHLEMLFCDVLNMKPKFKTDKNNPSFRRQFLGQFGDSGKLLERRRGLIVEIQQMSGILEDSQDDSRWRPRIKMVGTATGRMAGGSHG